MFQRIDWKSPKIPVNSRSPGSDSRLVLDRNSRRRTRMKQHGLHTLAGLSRRRLRVRAPSSSLSPQGLTSRPVNSGSGCQSFLSEIDLPGKPPRLPEEIGANLPALVSPEVRHRAQDEVPQAVVPP